MRTTRWTWWRRLLNTGSTNPCGPASWTTNTQHTRDEEGKRENANRVRWAKTAQLFDVIYVQFSRVGTDNKKKKVPTKFLADAREKITRLKKHSVHKLRETPAAAAGQRRNKTNKKRKTRTAANTQPTAIKRPASNGLQFPTINLLGSQERTHTYTSPTVEIMPRKHEDNFVRRRLFLFPLVPFSSKAKRAKHSQPLGSLSLSRDDARFFWFRGRPRIVTAHLIAPPPPLLPWVSVSSKFPSEKKKRSWVRKTLSKLFSHWNQFGTSQSTKH